MTYISTPQGCKSEAKDYGYSISMEATNIIPKREIRIFYKTDNMLHPQLKYKIDKEKDEVACMVSFVPTFEPVMP